MDGTMTTDSNEATMGGITGIKTVRVPVTDQDLAVEFYVERLGFEKRLDAPLEQLGGRWIEVAPPGSAMTIALVPARKGLPAGVETGIGLTTDDAIALHQSLREHGFDTGELLLWDGIPPMFALRDQDGNALSVTGS